MSIYHSKIEPIVNRNYGNKFQHHNRPNQRQQNHKNTSQQYQSISYQIQGTSYITYLKEEFIGCGIKNKYAISLLMQHDKKLETCPSRVTFFIDKNSPR